MKKRLKLFQGKVLRQKRELFGLSLDELALRAGCTKSYVWDLEQGKAEPGIGIAVKLADALGCDVYAFVGRDSGVNELAMLGARVKELLAPVPVSPVNPEQPK